MFKFNNTLLLAAVVGLAALTGCNKSPDQGGKPATGGAEKPSAAAAGEPVAVVNGTVIGKDTLDAYTKQRNASRPDAGPDDTKAALDELISREVIYQDALAKGLDKKPEIVAELENQKRNILANLAIRQHIESTPITDEALKKEYESHLGTMGAKEYKAKHVLVKTEDEAKAIIADLDKGGDFAAIAKEKSIDTGSGQNGGDLGWFDPKQMVKPFADAVTSMEKGTYTKTPVQSQFGWHVILAEDSRDVAPPEFDKVKENVRGVMRNKQIKDYLESLKAKAKVEIKLATAPAPAAPAPAAAPAATPAPAPAAAPESAPAPQPAAEPAKQ